MLKFEIFDVALMLIVLFTICINGLYLSRKLFSTNFNLISVSLGLGSVPIIFGMTFLLFTKQLTYTNTVLLLLALQFPLINLLKNNNLKPCLTQYFNSRNILQYTIICVIFLIIILTFTEYLTPGDKYRWVAIKQFIENAGYVDVSYDFRNMAPFYSELFLLLGMILKGESLALMINILFSLFLSISLFEYFFYIKKIPSKISFFFTILFIVNTCFLIDGLRGYISNTVAFFLWISYVSIHLWKINSERKYLYVSILFSGIAAGCKLHALFCVILFGFFVFFLTNSLKTNSFNFNKSFKNAFVFVTGAIVISSPWYLINLFLTGDPVYPYLSKSFYNSLELGTDGAKMLDPTLWSGVEPIFSNLLKPFYIMLTDPYSLAYGFEFGIVLISLLPFYFINKKNKFQILTLFFIIIYYIFWFFTHQNVRYILYVYPIIFSLPFINLYYFLKNNWNNKTIKLISYCSVILIILNTFFQSINFGNYVYFNKKLNKRDFFKSYSGYLKSANVDSLVNSSHNSPRIISNQRDFYYLETTIDYEQVWFDDIVGNSNVKDIKIKLEDYKNNGYTHLIYYSFSDDSRHEVLINSGAVSYLDKLKHVGKKNVVIYELK